MKKILVVLILLFPLKLLAPADLYLMILQAEVFHPYEKIWQAAIYVESRGDPFAVNPLDPNGGSWGIVQIGQLKLNEYNLEHGTNLVLKDCFDVEISKKIFMHHMAKYNDIETAIRGWNGSGPKTLEYWSLIQKALLLVNN